MKNCMKIEMKKALFNKTALFIFFVVILLVVCHAVTAIKIFNRFYSAWEMGDIQGNPMLTSMSLFCRWIGADVTSFESNIFFFLLPVIAVLPYGWSLAGEIQSGYTKSILCRTSRRKYFVSKYIAVFSSAAIIIVVPLIVNFILLSLFLPALKMEIIYPYGILGQRSMWSGIYYEAPFLYIVFYILLDAVFAGLIASISTAFAFFTKYKVTAIFLPLFVMLVIDYFDTNFSSGWELSPIKFLHTLPVANDRTGLGILVLGSLLIIGTLGILLRKGTKYEVL